ncbi:MAG: hypothetical protein A2428_01855 [Bdellovibrionales bacterium RIFOXYC1_FULL_54_43]|nr:MAG: hypothetical protein A2428_01855 [Bdellovibrionales bacterium RIFOXYC1_FULL_54_43]OFZ81684.1 MAG: hypothetical protein A2603_12065 [Bdellovibrionales bacterium RIFOXYD1_FULL_55_31]
MKEKYDAGILFVDDEPEILGQFRKMFAPLVDRVVTFQTAREALAYPNLKCMDLAVLDLHMPEVDGIRLLMDLRKASPGLPCVFVTGYGDKDAVQAALRLGAEDFLDKPFHPDALRNCVMRALEKRFYDKLMNGILELFIYDYTKLDFRNFNKMPLAERERALEAALGLARMKLLAKTHCA